MKAGWIIPFILGGALQSCGAAMNGQLNKYYEAIRGNWGTTRPVLLPREPHWYTALKSNEQLFLVRWFEKYVKNAPPR